MNNEKAAELVEGLRRLGAGLCPDAAEVVDSAADEIERLRAALGVVRSDLGMMMLPSHSLQMHQEKLISAINEVLK